MLLVQACLLFYALDLLPVWTDEQFTIYAVDKPISEIVTIVQHDIHPPLYFILLHAWHEIPMPWVGVEALRAFSAIWTLIATVLLDLFWLRALKPSQRWLALWLFALSPCLLLYGRMARSYSMQAALSILALSLCVRWMNEPRSLLRAGAAAVSVIALLYTHYVPGLAVLAAFLIAGWRSLGPARAGIFAAAVLAGYFPWLTTLIGALTRWGRATSFDANYAISGNVVLEQFIKIGFGLVSLTIGESFLAVSLLLVPVILLLTVIGARSSELPRRVVWLIVAAAVIGYLGVSRWASYPFIPARLLWLLPFLMLAVTLGISGIRRIPLRNATIAVILLSYTSSCFLYFRRENFLNLGYTAPLPEIAAKLNHDAQAGDLIIMDAYNTDSQVLASQLSGRTPAFEIDLKHFDDLHRRIASTPRVWIVRNTRDISPGHITTRLQNEACAGRVRRDTLLEPYAQWQKLAMRIAGFHPVLTHFYELTECGPPQ